MGGEGGGESRRRGSVCNMGLCGWVAGREGRLAPLSHSRFTLLSSSLLGISGCSHFCPQTLKTNSIRFRLYSPLSLAPTLVFFYNNHGFITTMRLPRPKARTCGEGRRNARE